MTRTCRPIQLLFLLLSYVSYKHTLTPQTCWKTVNLTSDALILRWHVRATLTLQPHFTDHKRALTDRFISISIIWNNMQINTARRGKVQMSCPQSVSLSLLNFSVSACCCWPDSDLVGLDIYWTLCEFNNSHRAGPLVIIINHKDKSKAAFNQTNQHNDSHGLITLLSEVTSIYMAPTKKMLYAMQTQPDFFFFW